MYHKFVKNVPLTKVTITKHKMDIQERVNTLCGTTEDVEINMKGWTVQELRAFWKITPMRNVILENLSLDTLLDAVQDGSEPFVNVISTLAIDFYPMNAEDDDTCLWINRDINRFVERMQFARPTVHRPVPLVLDLDQVDGTGNHGNVDYPRHFRIDRRILSLPPSFGYMTVVGYNSHDPIVRDYQHRFSRLQDPELRSVWTLCLPVLHQRLCLPECYVGKLPASLLRVVASMLFSSTKLISYETSVEDEDDYEEDDPRYAYVHDMLQRDVYYPNGVESGTVTDDEEEESQI